jgi:hypothetical protein
VAGAMALVAVEGRAVDKASTMDRICQLSKSQLFKPVERKTAEVDSSIASHLLCMMPLSTYYKAKNKTYLISLYNQNPPRGGFLVDINKW